ncbi:MAG: hypothetical protein JNJ89_02895 [Rubrivivax sp.]|nr:hypothetical protein [Rubrivivax sp.]MBL8340513.1 hypothetical protein [Rubrivivax sp.]
MQLVRTALVAASLVGAALPLRAEVFAIALSSDGAKVMLYAKSGPCVGQARLAEHVAPDGEKTPGCWVLTSSHVLVSFLDGDRGNIPVAQLKRVADL